MNKLLKYKYYILFFIILELCLFTYLTIEKQNKIQTYIDKQSSIIVTNYNTIQSIYKKTSNINLNTIEVFKQLKIEMEKFLDVDIYFLIDKKYIQNSKKIYIKSRENPNYYYNKNFLEITNKNPIAIKNFNKDLLQQIDTKLKTNKNFSIYKYNEKPKIGTFISLKDIKDNKIMSYLVVYQNSSYLNEIQTTYIILLLTGTMGLILLTLFIYQIKNEQNILEEMVNEKTKEFKELNESLENIVEKRTNEQAILLSLFDKGDNVLFKWKNNEKWSIEHVSKNVENLFGYNSKEFLSGKVEYTEVIHKDDLVNVIKEVSNIIDTQGDFYIHKPYRIITKDGHIKWIKNYRITVKNKKDKITNFVGYITDITAEINHQKELEKEVKEKTKSLKELNDNLEEQIQIEILKNTEKEKLIFQQLKMASMGEMLANIAHQWRQPLNSISISASGLQLQKELGQLNDEIFQYGIDGIIESTDFLSQTIDDFQNFLKPNDEISKFDIKNSIEKSLQLVVATFKKSSICTVLNVSDILVSGKQGEFTQVILNIINNAKDILIEKNEINNRFILIDTNFIENEVIISIKDNAGGIPKDIINNIFDQYFTTKDTDGTGIGLHMSKEIIESHMNGKLEVKNDTFKINDTLCSGANFIITLPTEEK